MHMRMPLVQYWGKGTQKGHLYGGMTEGEGLIYAREAILREALYKDIPRYVKLISNYSKIL